MIYKKFTIVLAAILAFIIIYDNRGSDELNPLQEDTPIERAYSYSESDQVDRIALLPEFQGVIVEFRNSDGTRTDLLTEDYAYEVDRSFKWAEAIGQSLHYANINDKKPGLILLYEDIETEQKYIDRCISGSSFIKNPKIKILIFSVLEGTIKEVNFK